MHWEGYASADNSWEDAEHIIDDGLIREYRRGKRAAKAVAQGAEADGAEADGAAEAEVPIK